MKPSRLVVVSNRLPVVLKHDKHSGKWSVEPGMGGLVTALSPVLRGRGGLWIGWPGTSNPAAASVIKKQRIGEIGYRLCPVMLTEEEVEGYYHGFSNEIVWPLFHDLLGRCNFEPAYWPVYKRVNQTFARAIRDNTREDDYIWIQDYHLMLGAAMLDELGIKRRCGFFLHIPFPPLDIFLKIPWRFQILQGLLRYELLAFQTVRDRRNFIQCVRTLLPGARLAGPSKMVAPLRLEGRTIHLGAFPIGIDAQAFANDAASPEVAEAAWFTHEKLPQRQLVLGVDRLDYTKGIPERIRAVGRAFELYPELRGKITFIQVVVPSRAMVPQYQRLKEEIEQLVGRINGLYTTSGWTPIHYIFRPLSRVDLLAYYRTSEIALITPLKDGMNLVAKEYCACSLEENGVLILSEFAGAAGQLQRGALLVNPHDIDGVAAALHHAFHMNQRERRGRMRGLRRTVQRYNVFWWVDTFLRAAIAHDLSDFPPVEYYVPHQDEADDWAAQEGLER